MTTFILGASGATGRQLVAQLLQKDQKLKLLVRSLETIPEHWKNNRQVTLIQGSISDLSVDELAMHVKDCDAVASCLGHNLTWKGIYGEPRKLVKEAIENICEAIQKKDSSPQPTKLVLMNTTGNRNRDLKEAVSFAEKVIFRIIRGLLPPQKDNEMAADYLRTQIGQNHTSIEWVAVRPDGLIDHDLVSEYEVYPSPIRSALFNPGKTSRINVGHFMASLITMDDLWNQWKGQMPVIYNKTEQK